MKYRISEAAYRDLDEIWLYTFQEWSEHQANKYFESIIQEIEFQSEHPDKAKQMLKVSSEFFYFRALSHYVFFQKRDDKIDIIRIIHKRMNFSEHME